MALASIIAGAQGVMVEVHPDPEHALSDGPQSLHFKEFEKLREQIRNLEIFVKQKLNT